MVLCLGLRAPAPPLRAAWFCCLLLLIQDLYRFPETAFERAGHVVCLVVGFLIGREDAVHLPLDAVVYVAQHVVALLEFHEEPVLCHLLFKLRAAEAVV